MKKMLVLFCILLSIILSGISDKSVLAYDDYDYPYYNSPCLVNNQCPSYDPVGFCRSHCTSYVAYVLKEVYGISDFGNTYKQPSGYTWSNGGLWDSAAGRADILYDQYPLPGDVAYWNTLGGTAGHVAWVERVYFDNGNPTNIDITEYNYNACAYTSRTISASNPDGFIHILAYNEGVTGLYYLDSYETSAPGQTKQEWGWILNRVWNNYRCTNCESDYNSSYISTIAASISGMGGGPGYEIIATESPDPDLPDFVLDSLILKNSSGVEKYVFNNTETIQMHSYSENIGDADWAAFPGEDEADDIYVKFYLSNGYKEDDHDDWIRVGNEQIQKGNLDVGDTKHESATLNLATANNGSPLAPGVYNIVACVDRVSDQDNEDGEVPEKHKSNNCSTEAVFTVQTIGQQRIKWLLPIINFILQD
jgi:hypothetical protein